MVTVCISYQEFILFKQGIQGLAPPLLQYSYNSILNIIIYIVICCIKIMIEIVFYIFQQGIMYFSIPLLRIEALQFFLDISTFYFH